MEILEKDYYRQKGGLDREIEMSVNVCVCMGGSFFQLGLFVVMCIMGLSIHFYIQSRVYKTIFDFSET